MANPQKENGYTSLANDLLEALARMRINGEARQVLDVIFRKTYGYNKKEDAIPLSQFVLATGLLRRNICRAINKLVQMNLILKNDTTPITIYGIQKDFELWKPILKNDTGSVKIENKRSQKRHTQKKKDNKEINKEKISELFNFFIQQFEKNPKRYTLTEGRRAKLKSRLQDCGEELIRDAITNTANSKFHRGENDRNWQADLDFIIRTPEQVQNLADKKLQVKKFKIGVQHV